MILGLLLASLSLQSPFTTIQVSRGKPVIGASVGEPSFTYWDCEDTTLDATDPDASRGGEATLVGSSSSVILIRFGDLSRVIGHSRHIRKASIHFTLAAGEKPTLASASRLLQPWGEGPYQTIKATLNLLAQPSPDAKQPKSAVPKMAATWRARQAGYDNGNWQQPGAHGPLDSVGIPEATAVSSDKEVEIQGLANAFQWLADHPSHNNGIALSFSNSVEVFSAQAPQSRPRLELELDESHPVSGPDLSVVSIERRPEGGFMAHVKNVGDSPSKGFGAVWSVNGRIGSTVDHNEVLAPGQETTLTTTEVPRADAADPRSGTVAVDCVPTALEPNVASIGLTVFSQARHLDFVITPGVADLVKKSELLQGDRSIEDWLQSQVRIFNETYLAQSHFSFAPDGAKERVAVQSIVIDASANQALKGDGKVVVTPEMFGTGGFSPKLAKAIGLALGLIDYDAMNVVPRSGKVTVPGASDRGTEDLFAGIMGGGDTRFDGAASGVLMMSNEPDYSTAEQTVLGEPTGLLAMTDVFILDSKIGKPQTAGLPAVSPKAILLQTRDLLARPMGGVSLSFYQSSGSKIPDGPPIFKLTSGDSGNSVIPNREAQGIFGKLEADGSNGLLLVKAEANGVTEWGWIKAWQIVDAYARGIVSAAILSLTFDLPGAPLERDRDLATQKFVGDSTGQSPDILASIVDGDGGRTVALAEQIGGWVEIDLGRDRTLAEIKLSASDKFWQSFDILLYGTGQRPQDALVFARERNWLYSRKYRSDATGATSTVSYRGQAVQVRYIRIVNRSGGRGEIGKISVIAAKLSN